MQRVTAFNLFIFHIIFMQFASICCFTFSLLKYQNKSKLNEPRTQTYIEAEKKKQ